MRFFYVTAANKAVGPVEADALAGLRREGAVTDRTPVAREGDTVWRTYAFYMAPRAAADAVSAAGPDRPAVVRVFGVANIVFGALGALCCPIGMGSQLFSASAARAGGAPLFSAWLLAAAAIGFFLSLAEIASGIGLLRMAPWGRRLAIGCCLTSVVLVMAGGAFNLMHAELYPPLADLGAPSAMLLMTIGEGLFGLAYPAAQFVALRIPEIRAAFERPKAS